MRHRRVRRCLLRAEIALEAGFADDAREALDEAKQLGAPTEEIERIGALIEDSAVPAPAPPQPWLSWRAVAAAVIVMMAAAIIASMTLLREPPLPEAVTVPAAAPPFVRAEPPAVQNVPAPSADSRTLGTGGTETPPPAVERPEPAPPTEEPIVTPEPPRSDPLDVQRDTVAVPSAASSPSPAPTPPPSTADFRIASAPPLPAAPAVPEPTPVRETSTTSAPLVVTLNVDPVPDLRAAPARDESADVRAVLSRYENAYSELDPSQARAVWPSVDEKALSRAFGNLSSQRVSLGRCDVTLSGTHARAVCAGSATWTPKVGGGGARTERRHWTFDLTKSGESWTIDRAVAR